MNYPSTEPTLILTETLTQLLLLVLLKSKNRIE
jgi:hypothetical protein